MRDIKTDLSDEKLMNALTEQARNNRGVAEKFVYMVHCYLTDDDIAEVADCESYGDDPYDAFDDLVRTWANGRDADIVLNLLSIFSGIRGTSWFRPYGEIAEMLVIYYRHLQSLAQNL